MAADRPLPIKTIRIRLDAPYFPRFVVQFLGPTSWTHLEILPRLLSNCRNKRNRFNAPA